MTLPVTTYLERQERDPSKDLCLELDCFHVKVREGNKQEDRFSGSHNKGMSSEGFISGDE